MPTIVKNAFILIFLTSFSACAQEAGSSSQAERADPANSEGELAKAMFAAGCFWCVEQAFDEVKGVKRTVSGYSGGDVPDPTYEQVSGGGTGHREVVLVYYDPGAAGYKELLQNFWLNVDPTDDGGQFCDRGASYKSAIFYFNEKQQRLAQASKQELTSDPEAPSPIVTPVLPAQAFYPAEEYHQNYYEKNPVRYNYYKFACGRADRLEELWGDAAGGVG